MRLPVCPRVICLSVIASLLVTAPALADGLIDNVNGITVDATGGLIHFNGLLIDKDGRVVKRLEPGDPRPQLLDFRYDGKGQTLLPGLFDAHGHVMELGLMQLELDLTDTNSLDEAKAKIAAYAKANPDRRWILGWGWNQEKWGLGRFPTAADLAGLVPAGTPIWLSRVDGHAGWANDAALAAAKITAASKAPAGGQIIKAAGKPTGVLVDNAMALMTKVVPQPSPRDYDAAFQKAQETLLAHGVTAIADMATSIEAWQAFRRAGDTGRLRIRIIGYGRGVDQATLIAGDGPTPWLYDDKLRLVGVKFFMDGALGSRGAWLKAPYADAPGTGLPRTSGTVLRNQMSLAAMDGFQTAVHAIGDRANAEVLDAIDALAPTYTGDRRWRIEHAQIIAPADLPRFAQHGIIASMQPQHETSDWKMAIARLGPDRLAGAYSWRTMLDNHVPLAFGSDVPVEPAYPFLGLKAAITREDSKGQPPGGWLPEQKLTLPEALRAYTWGAAYAGFAEKQFGNLAPGQKADFLIVDRDIATIPPAQLPETKVLQVWIGGRQMTESAGQ